MFGWMDSAVDIPSDSGSDGGHSEADLKMRVGLWTAKMETVRGREDVAFVPEESMGWAVCGARLQNVDEKAQQFLCDACTELEQPSI